MYIDDCVEGIYRLMRSAHSKPLNLGTDELVTINQLVDMVASVAGRQVRKKHDPSKPQGVRGRNSDNSRLRQALGWEPKTLLREGLAPTYRWIQSELQRTGRLPASAGGTA
jgi:nucleoside-diphosphate-sugar epimerase